MSEVSYTSVTACIAVDAHYNAATIVGPGVAPAGKALRASVARIGHELEPALA
jgi:hypothetical protein